MMVASALVPVEKYNYALLTYFVCDALFYNNRSNIHTLARCQIIGQQVDDEQAGRGAT
jgi:hypothetical protein